MPEASTTVTRPWHASMVMDHEGGAFCAAK